MSVKVKIYKWGSHSGWHWEVNKNGRSHRSGYAFTKIGARWAAKRAATKNNGQWGVEEYEL